MHAPNTILLRVIVFLELFHYLSVIEFEIKVCLDPKLDVREWG